MRVRTLVVCASIAALVFALAVTHAVASPMSPTSLVVKAVGLGTPTCPDPGGQNLIWDPEPTDPPPPPEEPPLPGPGGEMVPLNLIWDPEPTDPPPPPVEEPVPPGDPGGQNLIWDPEPPEDPPPAAGPLNDPPGGDPPPTGDPNLIWDPEPPEGPPPIP